MKILPWFIAVVALMGVAYLFSNSKKLDAELAALRQEVQQLAEVRGENAVLKRAAASAQDVERLQKDAAEVHKLRNEVRQLRTDNQQLAAKVAQPVEIESRPPIDTGAVTMEQLLKENQQLRNEAEEFHRARIQAQSNACINNLRQLDGAKEQWALEHRKRTGDITNWEELIGESGYIRRPPACAAGGQYTLNPVGQNPTCTIVGHQLPQ